MGDLLSGVITNLITYFGATPVLLFLTVASVGDIAAVVWVVYKLGRIMANTNSEHTESMSKVFDRQDRRFEQVVRMYEDNVALVKSYETHVSNQCITNDKLIDLVSISTATQQTLVEYIKHNLFCPLVRQRTKPGNIEEDRLP